MSLSDRKLGWVNTLFSHSKHINLKNGIKKIMSSNKI